MLQLPLQCIAYSTQHCDTAVRRAVPLVLMMIWCTWDGMVMAMMVHVI